MNLYWFQIIRRLKWFKELFKEIEHAHIVGLIWVELQVLLNSENNWKIFQILVYLLWDTFWEQESLICIYFKLLQTSKLFYESIKSFFLFRLKINILKLIELNQILRWAKVGTNLIITVYQCWLLSLRLKYILSLFDQKSILVTFNNFEFNVLKAFLNIWSERILKISNIILLTHIDNL